MTTPKFDIEVELIGNDGNAFSIMGAVSRELKRAGATKEQRDEYFAEATAGDYDNLLRVTSHWVNIV